MKTRILFKYWLGALALCALIAGTFCITPGPKVKVKDAPKGPTTPTVAVKLDDAKKPGTELTPDPVLTLLVLATLDGTLTAVDRFSGELRWISKDEPMIKVPAGPASAKAPYFLPDPKTGSLYVMGRKNSLRKLPFTIPQLVAMAPCRNSEGLMYTGRKMDYWLTLNPTTGEKSELPSHGDSTCPAKSEDDVTGSCTTHDTGLPGILRKSLLIGKTEYTLSMVDGPRKWNVTYHHYSSVDMTAQSAQDYDLVHFTSPSTGAVLTYDRESGQLLWQRELASPVIAVYNVDCTTSNLVSVPFNPIAPETLTRLKSVAAQNNKPLSHTTYIGESNYGLYAVPALVDETVLLMASEGSAQFPPLIEGPSLDSNDTPENNNNLDGSSNNNLNNNSLDPQGEADYLLLGYYDIPEPTGKPPVMQITASSSSSSSSNSIDNPTQNSKLPAGQFNESEADLVFIPPPENYSNKDKLELLDPVPLTQPSSTNDKVQFPPFPFKPLITPAESVKSVKPIKIVFTTAAISVLVTVTVIIVGMMTYRKFYGKKEEKILSTKKIKEKTSDTEEESSPILSKKKRSKKSADGSYVSVGKICFYPSSVLGKGCEGTFVYKGKFEDRDVAVKRILPECFAFADREVDLLKESDQHPNVIRYFCTEADDQFRYIALELCEATLSDWIEGKFVSDVVMDPIEILREATDGLAHLHSMQIVHRDIKPANVLLSVQANGRQVRTMISDFGLCKKIANGRMSFSRRSGGIPGTEGWIAPEVIKNMEKEPQRMSFSVDVFSLGCVYYYVLTKGEHPFGEPFRRQSNIVNDDCNLDKVSQNPQGVFDLINLMISADANARPPLEDVLCHPLFWSREKMLTFLLDVSDRIEKEDENKCPLMRRLESDGTRVVRQDWRDHICPEVAMDLRKYRTYKGQSVRDLLRALRNKKNHYRELTPEAQASLGHIPEQFVQYWLGRFPDLLPYTWLIFESVRYETIFSKYYPKSYSFNANVNGPVEDTFGVDYDNNERLGDNLSLPRSISPEKSPKIDKNFWRSKSQFKYNKWRRQQQNNNLRENPHNFVSYATQRYPPVNNEPQIRSPDTDNSWRNPVPK